MHCIGIGKDPAGFILKLNHKRHLLNKGMNEMFNKLNKNATIFKELSKTSVTGNQEYIKIGNEATSKIATIVHQKR